MICKVTHCMYPSGLELQELHRAMESRRGMAHFDSVYVELMLDHSKCSYFGRTVFYVLSAHGQAT